MAETYEELGLTIPAVDLRGTSIRQRYVKNRCRRLAGDHHSWWVFEIHLSVVVELRPDPDETQDAAWYSRGELQELAERTREFQSGAIPAAAWVASPGIEEIWLEFLTELKYVT